MMKSRTLNFTDINVGDTTSFTKSWSEQDVANFAKLSRDNNPLHMDESYAKKTKLGKRVVHGMLVASSFSELAGMHLPGTYCLYLSQTLKFKQPVFIGDELTITGTVTNKSESTSTLTITTTISNKSQIVVEGEAIVQVLTSIL